MDHTLRDIALKQAAACATERYPGEEKRIERGLLLALNDAVQLGFQDTATVQSGTDREVYYSVWKGICDCADRDHAPGFRCKHRWAVIFTTIAREALNR